MIIGYYKLFLLYYNEDDRKKPRTIKLHCMLTGPYNGMPEKVIGMYILLADDTEPG